MTDAFDALDKFFHSNNEMSDVQETITKMLTLENLFEYGSYDEKSAIVHSIYGRINDVNEFADGLTDKELAKIVKELRTPK